MSSGYRGFCWCLSGACTVCLMFVWVSNVCVESCFVVGLVLPYWRLHAVTQHQRDPTSRLTQTQTHTKHCYYQHQYGTYKNTFTRWTKTRQKLNTHTRHTLSNHSRSCLHELDKSSHGRTTHCSTIDCRAFVKCLFGTCLLFVSYLSVVCLSSTVVQSAPCLHHENNFVACCAEQETHVTRVDGHELQTVHVFPFRGCGLSLVSGHCLVVIVLKVLSGGCRPLLSVLSFTTQYSISYLAGR